MLYLNPMYTSERPRRGYGRGCGATSSRNTRREEKQINLGRDLPPSSLISLKIPHPLPSLLDQRVSRQTGKIVPVHIGSLRWKMEGMMGWMLAWPRSVAVGRSLR